MKPALRPLRTGAQPITSPPTVPPLWDSAERAVRRRAHHQPLREIGWMSEALCAKIWADWWDEPVLKPDGRGEVNTRQASRARLVCGECPVAVECLRDGWREDGIRAGLSRYERRKTRLVDVIKKLARREPDPYNAALVALWIRGGSG